MNAAQTQDCSSRRRHPGSLGFQVFPGCAVSTKGGSPDHLYFGNSIFGPAASSYMELSELSLTQSSVQLQKILVDAQGNPLKVNLQAVELEGRPKLVRMLKSSGALVVSSTKEANILLVDSATESGKRLIRTWGHDPRNVVLEYTWAQTSIDAGRPLLEADNWGGTMTVDDGKPVTIDGIVVDEDELQEVEALVTKSPFPTPRVTPVDPASRQLEHIGVEPAGESNTSVQIPVPQPPEPPAAQPIVANPSCAEAPMMMASQLQSFPHAGFPASQPHMMHAQTIPHVPFHQPQVMQMGPNPPSTNGVNAQAPNLAAIMTIMEVVRHMDQSAWFGHSQMPLTQPPANLSPFFMQAPIKSEPTMDDAHAASLSTHNFQSNGGFEATEIVPSVSSSQDRVRGGSTSLKHQSSAEHRSSTRKSQSSRRWLSDEVLEPSISRKGPPAVKPTNPPAKRSRKGKEKAVSPEPSEHSEVDQLAGASDDSSFVTHSSTPLPAQSQDVAAHKLPGEIFLSKSGQPLQFFVQVDLHGRHNVVSNIKKNKGKIVNNIADADYLILFTRSDTFQGLLSEASALGKFPIQAAFVADCIKEGVLTGSSGLPLKRGRQNAFSIKIETPETSMKAVKAKGAKQKSSVKSKMTKPPPETPSKYAVGKKTKSASKPTPSSTSKPASLCKPSWNGQEKPISSRSRGSPTPPPAETRKMMKNGNYLFTEVEDDYFLRFAKYYLDRDPSTPNTSLVQKLHKKVSYAQVHTKFVN
ncbi:hypothetical protein BU15DRAFT_59388 [Melanogaster broomeanus]|nr:hypothetical protein BU15DRAFT_59388 [Melanogaster broomeanus]